MTQAQRMRDWWKRAMQDSHIKDVFISRPRLVSEFAEIIEAVEAEEKPE